MGTNTSKQAQKAKQGVSEKPTGVCNSKHGQGRGALKPCPFCGSMQLRECDEDVLLVSIACEKCGAEGPYAYHSIGTAKRLWNRRV